MPKSHLAQRRVDTLKARKKTLDVRDSVIRGLGVPILPSGRKRYLLHGQTDNKTGPRKVYLDTRPGGSLNRLGVGKAPSGVKRRSRWITRKMRPRRTLRNRERRRSGS